MNFICDDKKLLEKYKEICGKIRSKFGKELAKEPTYRYDRNVYINSKIREYGGVIRTKFY